jgi:propionyl-CoA carboxylase alpha chain
MIKLMPVSAAVDTTKVVSSPMAGQLISVAVEVGQQVAMGQEICVVEAMKMQNVLRAERDGVIKAIKAEAGKPVQLDQIIVELA